MKVGDLIRRKKIASWRGETSSRRTVGMVLSLQTGGMNPSHPCATIYYQDGKIYDIAVSLIEVIND